MPTFVYEALRGPSDPIRGEISGDNRYSAAAALRARGYHVLRIEDCDARAAARLRPRLGIWGGIRRKDLTRFTRDVGNLLRAGLPLSQALQRFGATAPNAAWKGLAGGLRARLEDGRTLSQALAEYPDVFDPMYINMIAAGETSGRLAESLLRLAGLAEKRAELGAGIKAALVYPSVMLVLGAATVLVLVLFVAPTFLTVFEESGQVLPLPTRSLLALSGWGEQWWWLFLPGILAAMLAARRFARTPSGRQLLDRILLHLPLFGPLLRKKESAAFTRTFGGLLESGIPALSALTVTARAQANSLYQSAIEEMVKAVTDGSPVSRVLGHSGLFSDLVASAIAVGEDTGEMSQALERISEECERELDRELKVFVTLLEPLMIVLMGGVVGFVVIAMVLPIFDLGNTIQF